LRFLALLTIGTFVFYAPVVLPVYSEIPLFGLMLAMTGTLAGTLWGRWPLSLPTLRRFELALFGSQALYNLWVSYRFFRAHWLDTLASHGWFGMTLAGRNLSWFWVVLILVYGVLIPNTWRRCTVFVGVLALCPIVLSFFGALLESAVPAPYQVVLLVGIVLDMAMASVIAVFGAHRLETLRGAAAEARKLGQYQLKQRLGAGGMGEVYLAEHVLLRRPCALKLIRPERVGDPNSLRRFEREVQVTATLTHPNTIEIFDYGHAADGTFYYVMEYLPGPNLEELVRQQGPLPPGRAVHLLRQVCGSLAEAHAAGLIHRDIKPTNIISCQRGGRCDVAKLLDFGLARRLDPAHDTLELTQEGAIAGTPQYMSPEQAAGGGALDARSDLYSLGSVAYFLLTGQPPFVRATAVQTLAAHLGEPVVPPSRLAAGLPSDLEAVVLRCLEKDAARRFPDAQALERALAACNREAQDAGCGTEQ
jgi:serine/threonine-protein kinase